MGGVFTARAQGAAEGVEFTIVYSAHDNAVSPALLTKPQQDLLKADGAQLQYGPPVGFVVKFTNGLVVYLSSDTAVFGNRAVVIRRQRAELHRSPPPNVSNARLAAPMTPARFLNFASFTLSGLETSGLRYSARPR